jgi:hypothetical protein
LPVLLAVSLLLGTAYALTLLPLSFVAGTGDFWTAPHGEPPFGVLDMGDALIGYLYLMRAPWAWPLLHVANLGAPQGTNIFWLDAIPWLSLLGKAIFSATGLQINLLGIYDCICFSLPGVAMTVLLALAGQRSLIAMLSATVFADAAPVLVFRWVNLALSAHFLVIAALALYLASRARPASWRVGCLWIGLLTLAVLTNMYLFVMVGGCWAAALLQQCRLEAARIRYLAAEAVTTVAVVLGVMLAMGIVSSDLQHGGAPLFGDNSMNLVSMFIPQRSGIIRPLSDYYVGMKSQGEGFAYLGLGALAILAISLPAWIRFVAARWREHSAIIVVMAGFTLFALSNNIYIGSRLIVHMPLPDPIMYLLGTFRSSGRFSWPVVYALTAGSVILVLRHYSPAIAVPALLLACMAQLVDIGPLRGDIARYVAGPAQPVLDPHRVEAIVRGADAVFVMPSFGCVFPEVADGLLPAADRFLLMQANIEIQLAAARANRPINSVYNARIPPDCEQERRVGAQPLRDRTAYVYLTDFTPSLEQLGNRDPASVCGRDGMLRYCQIGPPAR